MCGEESEGEAVLKRVSQVACGSARYAGCEHTSPRQLQVSQAARVNQGRLLGVAGVAGVKAWAPKCSFVLNCTFASAVCMTIATPASCMKCVRKFHKDNHMCQRKMTNHVHDAESPASQGGRGVAHRALPLVGQDCPDRRQVVGWGA